MNIKQLYYDLWVDAILAAEKSNSYMHRYDKLFVIFTLYTTAQSANFALILLILDFFNDVTYFIEIGIFKSRLLNGAIEGVVLLFLPFAIVNYFLVFYKNRYQKHVEHRQLNTKGKALLLYAFCSFSLFIIVVILGKWVF
jgi:hypothetical protein